MIRKYYAYLAVAGGILLLLVRGGISGWAVSVIAYGLTALGSFALRKTSRWFLRAGIAAAVLAGLELVRVSGVVRPILLHWGLAYWALLPLLLMGCMLFCAAAEQARSANKSALPEWVLLTVWSAGILLPLLAAALPLNDVAAQLGVNASNVLYPVGTIGLIVVLFRAQRAALQCGEEK